MQVKSILTFIKLLFVIKNFVLSIFEWPFYTGFTVHLFKLFSYSHLAEEDKVQCIFHCSMFYALLCVLSSFTIILMGNRELVALLCLSSWCRGIVMCLFMFCFWVGLQCVIVVFLDHTHLLLSVHYYINCILACVCVCLYVF